MGMSARRPRVDSALKREPGKGARKEQGGGDVGPAAGVDRQFMFASVKPLPGFVRGGAQFLRRNIAEDEITGRVGMPCKRSLARGRQHVERGVLKGVIAAGFKDEGKVEEHGVIIREIGG